MNNAVSGRAVRRGKVIYIIEWKKYRARETKNEKEGDERKTRRWVGKERKAAERSGRLVFAPNMFGNMAYGILEGARRSNEDMIESQE